MVFLLDFYHSNLLALESWRASIELITSWSVMRHPGFDSNDNGLNEDVPLMRVQRFKHSWTADTRETLCSVSSLGPNLVQTL